MDRASEKSVLQHRLLYRFLNCVEYVGKTMRKLQHTGGHVKYQTAILHFGYTFISDG